VHGAVDGTTQGPRPDGLVVLRPGRIVDIAAAALIAREAGVLVLNEDGGQLDAPITMEWRGAFAIARVQDDVAALVAATRAGNEAGRR
jgi:fructose-1,6-bisphosphatase/inositol monophosphatase family enzyme